MSVAMAGRTLRLQFKEGLGFMALPTRKRRVASLKRISGLAVIKARWSRRPADQREVAARMLGVTTRAIGVAFQPIDDARMVPTVVAYSLSDLDVARGTLQLRASCTNRVALDALKGAFEIAMRFRQRSW
jgi:hypothetical protein